jgi:hypothetical protein
MISQLTTHSAMRKHFYGQTHCLVPIDSFTLTTCSAYQQTFITFGYGRVRNQYLSHIFELFMSKSISANLGQVR